MPRAGPILRQECLASTRPGTFLSWQAVLAISGRFFVLSPSYLDVVAGHPYDLACLAANLTITAAVIGIVTTPW
nr:hypothetical protein [Moorella sp. Hama-1]